MDDLVRYRSIFEDSARWDDLVHRPGDIVISTPPKCGTTLMQMLCALLIFDGPDFPDTLDRMSPWLDMMTRSSAEVLELLDGQQHRRFIKTHTPLDGIPIRKDVTYVVVGRDPRDVMVSWEHHADNIDPELIINARAAAVGLDDLVGFEPPPPADPEPIVRFLAFINDDPSLLPNPTLSTVLHHLGTGWARRGQSNVTMFHYLDLRHDLVGEMALLAVALGIRTSRTRLTELAACAGIDEMRSKADSLGPETTRNIYKDPAKFFRNGGSGEWREFTTDEADARYAQRVEQLTSPDLARWVHSGRR